MSMKIKITISTPIFNKRNHTYKRNINTHFIVRIMQNHTVLNIIPKIVGFTYIYLSYEP